MGSKRRKDILEDIPEEVPVRMKYPGPFPVHDACAKGDYAAVEELMARRDINSYNEDGKKPLHVAAETGSLDIIRLLLRADVDVNIPERITGKTPLHYACAKGHFDVVEALLLKGAVVFEQDKDGAYPMHLAAAYGSSRIIVQLKSVGALASCQDNDLAEPLHYAARKNKSVAVETLAKIGAPVDAMDMTGATPLHKAASLGHVTTIRQLIQSGAFIDSRCKKGETPLNSASTNGQAAAVGALVDLGADISTRNKNNESVLHTCARLGVWKSIPSLLQAGINITEPYKRNMQAVHIAAEYGRCEVLEVLSDHGANINAKEKKGNRPVHKAVLADQAEAIKTLVKLGADMNARNKKGNTVMHLAAKQKKPALVHLLGSLGADSNLENKIGVFPLYYAALQEDVATGKALIRVKAEVDRPNSERDRLVHILTEEGYLAGLTTLQQFKAQLTLLNKNGQTCVHIAAMDKQPKVLNHLRHLDVDINVRDKYGLSALHVAALDGDGDRVDLLHDIGADLECPSKDYRRRGDMPRLCRSQWVPVLEEAEEYWQIRLGNTPLQMAFLGNHKDVFDHIVTCGADVNNVNEDGETVFHMAVMFKRLDWIQYLLSKGIERNCVDMFGRSPLHYAAHYGHVDITRFLLKSGTSITAKDKEGRQPLHYAAEEGHYLLLPEFTGQSRAVDINCTDNHGQTPLHFACRSGDVNTIQELVQLGAKAKLTDQTGNTVVHIAAEGGNVNTIVLLASMGCSMDVKNKNGQTPLHVAGENGQGAAMEFLLMCGCDPNIRDLDGRQPSTHRLQGNIKQSVARRIRQVTAHTAARNTTGEVCHEGRVVNSGQQVLFRKLNISVTLTSDSPVSPLIFFHRTPSDAASLDIPVTALEEILSDVYDMRVLRLDRKCTLTVEIPMDGYPGNFESFMKTASGKMYKEFTTSEENGIPKFIGKLPVEGDTMVTFAVVVRPPTHTYTVGTEGATIMSEVDRNLRLEIPNAAFTKQVDIDVQVLQTSDTDTDVFATDVLNVIIPEGKQPLKDVNVRLPLHRGVDDNCEVMVYHIENESDIDDERRWVPVNTQVKIKNDCVSFNVHHFSIYVTVVQNRHVSEEQSKRMAKEKIKVALQRETSVLFFYATAPRKNMFLTIFECTTPGKFERRKEFWETEGFQFHAQLRHSGHFVARPNQEFYFNVTGNLKQLTEGKSRWTLSFNPRSYKYHSFYLTRAERNVPLMGEIHIKTSLPEHTESFVTSIPVEINEPGKICVIS